MPPSTHPNTLLAPFQSLFSAPTWRKVQRLIVGTLSDSSWGSPLDYGPVLLRKPFGFHLAVDTLPSGLSLDSEPT